PVLDVGPTPETRVCPGDGHVSVLSAWGAATHRRHHAGRSNPQAPPPSETLGCPPPSRLPVPGKHHVTGSPRPLTTRVGSEAPCAPWRWLHPSERMPSHPSAPLSDLHDCLRCTVAAGGRRWDTHGRRTKGLLIFLSPTNASLIWCATRWRSP